MTCLSYTFKMITFKLTFLLCFNINPAVIVSRKKKTGKRGRDKVQKQLEENNLEPIRDYELKSGNPISSIRIEYELLPKKFKYGVDILCWENLAKIITVDGFRYYRILRRGNLIWVPVTIHHFTKRLTDAELVSLHGHVMNCSITMIRKDNSPRPFILFCKQKEVKSEDFVEYFEEDPNQGRKRTGKQETDEMKNAASKSGPDGISSWQKFVDETHCYMVYDTISCRKKGSRIKYKQFDVHSNAIVDEPPSVKRNETKKSKKSKKKRKRKSPDRKKPNPHFVLPGEVFFTDPKLAVYKLKDPSDSIAEGFIYLSVNNLMTREQKNILNPFIIKLNSLKRLPADLLKKYGYQKIFISCEIPNLANYESQPKLIEENIYFDESHAYFAKDLPRTRYLEYIRNERVRVKINGVRREQQIEPSLFGTKKEDANFSKRLQPREAFNIFRKMYSPPRIQLIAVANFDISSLLKDVWTFREEAPCHHPNSLLHGIKKNFPRKFVDVYNISEANFGIDSVDSNSPLFEGILASALTALDMEFHFTAPQFATMHLQKNDHAFKRQFFIIYDRALARNILACILQHNENILGFNAISFNYMESVEDKGMNEMKKWNILKELSESDDKIRVKSEERVEETSNDVITGFMIDNGPEVYIFMEGNSHGYILEIWNKIHKFDTNVVKIFLNSANDFENRLYDAFLPTGILKITLRKSLQDLFKEQDIYIEGSIPILCYKGLQKLNLLLQTDTLQKMIRFSLLPDSDELMNLNIEFGVPLRLIPSVEPINAIP